MRGAIWIDVKGQRVLWVETGSAFAGGKIGYSAKLDGRSVLVWDDVARHWTTCHSLTKRQEAYVRSRLSAAANVCEGRAA